MFQYKMFLLKEWKQLMRNKKVIIYCLLFPLYTPLINYIATGPNPKLGNPLLPIEFCIPFFIIMTGLIASELTSDIMNKEFETKSYEILVVSKISKKIIVLSKVTLPILIGFSMSSMAMLINNCLPFLTNKDVFSNFATVKYMIFLILCLIANSLIYMLVIETKQKYTSKQSLTLIVGVILFGFIFPLYLMFYFKLGMLVILILITVSILLFYLSLISLHQHKFMNKVKMKPKDKFIKLENHFLVLCKEGYCHYWNPIKTVSLLLVTVFISLGCRNYTDQTALYDLLSLFPLITYFVVCNSIIFQTTLLEKKAHGFLHMKLAKISASEFIMSRVLYPFILNLICTVIIQGILLNSLLDFNMTLFYLSMNIWVCLLTLIFSLLEKDTQFKEQDMMIVIIMGLAIGALFINVNTSFIFIFLLNMIMFFLCSVWYKKRL